jgi:8-amino-7-oxononanoate synthase
LTTPFEQRLQKELDQRLRDNLLRVLEVGAPCRLNLSSNDYFQLRSHADVIAGARRALEDQGAGSGASPLLYGYTPCHQLLLEALKSWKRKSAGLVFNTGFMANQAVLKHLPGSRDLVLVDRLIHHSVIQAVLQGKADYRRYHHLDLHHLEELLAKHRNDYETVFVVTESVFSMDGDYPDLRALVELKQRHPFVLVLDEAHGTGVFGATGGGLAEEMGVLDEVGILVGTLGKALASMGAYVLTRSQTVIDYLVNYSGEFIYSTYLAPACAGAAEAALRLVQNMDSQRRRLRKNAAWLRDELIRNGWSTNPFDSQIVPVIIGDPDRTLALQNHLQAQGILLGAVRPPTVPANSSRLRVSLHTGVTREHLDEFLKWLNAWRTP